MTKITRAIAQKVLDTVDAGLVRGKGIPEPGKMCVEAAVCYALGLPHGDDPACVSRAVRGLKIVLNDSNWFSNDARAKGMRRLALVQLGSAGVLDDQEFSRRVAKYSIQVMVPIALRAAASLQKDQHHKSALEDAAKRCETEGTQESAQLAARSADSAWSAAWSADSAADSAAARSANSAAAARSAARSADSAAAWAAAWSAAARDKTLSNFAEGVVQILIAMDAPGAQWVTGKNALA
jgi:hypothetical protein